MRVLLVNPPIPTSYYNEEFYLPSGLLYLAAVLRDHGQTVQLLDMKTLGLKDRTDPEVFCRRRLRKTLAAFAPDLIGFGCLFSGNFPHVQRFARLCKEWDALVPIVVGGIHVTIHARDILTHCPDIDWLVLGEAEDTICQLVETLAAQRTGVDHIEGLAYRDGDTIRVQQRQRYLQDIDGLPFPAYDLMRMEDYFVDTSAWHNPRGLSFNTSIPLVSSRSCPHRCNFCSMFTVMGPRWRARSAANVVDEIQWVVESYGQTHFSFMDDNFTFDKARTLAICDQILSRGLNIQFETPNGVSLRTLDADVLEALVRAGLVRVSLAIESGSDFIRNRIMRKNLSREQILAVIEETRKYPDLYVKAFFIIGVPEETGETLDETYRMIERIDVDRVYLQNLIPFPGTAVFAQARRDGLLVDVDCDRLYCDEGMYLTNWERFYVKPYQLELEQLRSFRRRCETLLRQQQEGRARPVVKAITCKSHRSSCGVTHAGS